MNDTGISLGLWNCAIRSQTKIPELFASALAANRPEQRKKSPEVV